MHDRNDGGLSLVEVLVSLVMIGLVLTAAQHLVQTVTHHTKAVHQRMLAHWVAMNQMEWLRLTLSSDSSTHWQGEEVLAGQHWRWQAQLEPVLENTIHQITLTVDGDDPAGARYTLHGYVEKP